MNMLLLQEMWKSGGIEKKNYWTLMRENYTGILPQLQALISECDECESIHINKDSCVLIKKGGIKIYFDFAQTICRAEAEILMGDDPEKEEMIYLNNYIKTVGAGTVLDIGANVGLFSLELLSNNKDCNVRFHLFEPIPSTFEMLKKTALLNDLDPEFFIMHNQGMSDKKGTLDFYLPGTSEAASLKPVNDEFYLNQSNEMGVYTGKQVMDKIECSVSTVDNFVDEEKIDKIRLIKIDVEGNEKAVLFGAQRTLEKEHPVVYSELLRKHAKRFGYHPNEVLSYMNDLGYKCKTMRDGMFSDVPEITEETKETNFFFFYG